MRTPRRQTIQQGFRIKKRMNELYQLKNGTTSTTAPTQTRSCWDDMNEIYQLKYGTTSTTRPTQTRSWDDMNYEILLKIISRLSWHDKLFVVCLVSKTWLSAVLDTMSRPGLIDLRPMDSPQLRSARSIYLNFLKRRLNSMPPDSFSAFYHGATFLEPLKYRYIGKRTPSMQKVIIPRTVGCQTYSLIQPAMRHWKKLKDVMCPAQLISINHNNFTEVQTLRLFGVVDDAIAATIRDKCPQLKRLRLNECALSVNALSTILDGHKNLELLDSRHSFRVPDCRAEFSRFLEWNEEEIQRKAAGVKVHLKCARERCSKCAVPLRSVFPEAKTHFDYCLF